MRAFNQRKRMHFSSSIIIVKLMKEKELSSYKDNAVASKGNVILANLADYLISLVLTFLIYFAIASPVTSSFSSVKEIKQDITESQTSLKRIVSETHLQTLDSSSSLKSIDDMSEDFLYTYAKTSYYLNNKEFPYKNSNGQVTNKNVDINETFLASYYYNDPSAYYFFIYKSSQESLSSYVYDSIDYSSKKEEFFYEVKSLLNSSTFDEYFIKKTDEISIYRQLDIDKALLLTDYLVYGDSSSSSKEIANLLTSSFKRVESFFIDEVEANLTSYIKENTKFKDSYASLNGIYVLIFFISFIIAFSIEEFILPLFFKKNTLGLYSFKLAYCRLDDLEPAISNFLLKGIARFFMHMSCMLLVSFFLSNQSIFFYSYNGFAFAYIMLFSLALGIGSIITTLINKRHQGLGELASSLIVKDKREFETRVQEKEAISDGK